MIVDYFDLADDELLQMHSRLSEENRQLEKAITDLTIQLEASPDDLQLQALRLSTLQRSNALAPDRHLVLGILESRGLR